MRIARTATVMAMLLSLAAWGQTDQQAQQAIGPTVQAMAKGLLNWTSAGTPGLSVEARELGRKPAPGGQIVSYALYTKGFPKGAHLDLLVMLITQRTPQISLQGVTLDASGRALCDGKPDDCGDTGPDPFLYMQVIGSPGEPVRYGLITPDGKQRALGVVVPVPLTGTDHGCTLELLRAMPNAELVVARASGFTPHEKLTVTSTSHGEHRGGAAQADAGGNWTSLFEPAQIGKTGTLEVQVAGKSCNPQTSIQWGPGSYGR
jgi:hypothetical protein